MPGAISNGILRPRPHSTTPRRLEALRLVLYKLERLEHHLKASCLELNDLRTLRRLLLQERALMAAAARSK